MSTVLKLNRTYGVSRSRKVCKLNSSKIKKSFNDDLIIDSEKGNNLNK